MYAGDIQISKIGFQTNSQSRGQILTKFEQVIRNNSVTFYSSRLHDELKTFIWKGSKAQAQKGKNDDLVISAAIGTWLFDADPKRNKQSVDLNKAMLAGFAVNRRQSQPTNQNKWGNALRNPFKAVYYGNMPASGSSDGIDFSWV